MRKGYCCIFAFIFCYSCSCSDYGDNLGDGYFFRFEAGDLKDILCEIPNGGEIPAKQFIEEVVMSVGQEKYNGDINALLEDMTISDIGTISTAPRKKTPIGKELKQEHVMSQETSERREHKSFAERAKKNSEPLDNKQRKAGRSMTDRMTTMINVKRSISQSRITKSETQQQTEEMTNNVKVRKLLQKQNSGAFLTEEEKRFIEQHIRENTEAQIRFMNQQNKKRNRGIEM